MRVICLAVPTAWDASDRQTSNAAWAMAVNKIHFCGCKILSGVKFNDKAFGMICECTKQSLAIDEAAW